MDTIVVRGERKGKTYEVLLDREDAEWVATIPFWYVQPHGRTYYVWRNEWSGESGHRRKRKQALHRLIMERVHGPLGERHVDHVDGNGLDNRRINLRLTDRYGNMRNSRRRATKTSSVYKGVYRRGGTYVVRIREDGKTVSLGNYATERDAAIAYNLAAKRLFGVFARLNEIETTVVDEERVERLMEIRRPRRGERHDCRATVV